MSIALLASKSLSGDAPGLVALRTFGLIMEFVEPINFFKQSFAKL